MIYDERAYKGEVTPSQAAAIRRKVRDNMASFLGHREIPLNEDTVREQNAKRIERILANPDHYGEALVEDAEFRKRYYQKHGPARHINTPSLKLVKIMAGRKS